MRTEDRVSTPSWNFSTIPICAGDPAHTANLDGPRLTLANAVSENVEPLAPDVRTSFERAFTAAPAVESADSASIGTFGGRNVGAPDSPAEHSARTIGKLDASARALSAFPPAPIGLEDVRVHRGPFAARACAAVAARAFPLGNHVFFGGGQYDPESADGRRLIGHELTHVLQARRNGRTSVTESSTIMRETFSEKASKWYDEKKWAVYRGTIAVLKTAKNGSVQIARSLVPKFPTWMQGPVGTLIDIGDFVFDLIIALLLIIVGLAVGFVEGIVGLVTGLIKLAYGFAKLLTDMIVAMLGYPEAYRKDIDALVKTISNLWPAMKQFANDWIERYKKATLEEQAIMGGELIGQIEAFIATFAIAGTKAGQAAGVAEGAVGVSEGAVKIGAGGVAAIARAPVAASAVSAVVAKTTAEGAVISQQLLMMSSQGPGGAPPAAASGGGTAPSAVDTARAQVDQDLAAERSAVAQRKQGLSSEQWAGERAGATKRLYNLLERRAVLTRMKTFPGRRYFEQARIQGVRAGGKLTPTAEISATGKGRIADILELDGPQATLEDLKSANTQSKSVKGGMSSTDIEAQFRSTSEIEKQHEIEQQVIAEAKRTGGKVVVTGIDPITGASAQVELDPQSIVSRVTDYTDLGNN